MKKFIKEYLNVIAISITGLIFSVASFYLILNYYHYQELNRTILIGDNNYYYTGYKTKLNKISQNLIAFQNKPNKNNAYQKLHNNLTTCYNAMTDKGTLIDLKTNQYINSFDVYNLGGNLQSKLLNACWALHLSYLKDNNQEFKEITPYIVNNIESITNETSNAVSEIQNNSSYFYTTNITSATVRNYLNNDFNLIASSYDEFANIILLLSEKINDGGN